MMKLVLILGSVVALSACEREQPDAKPRWTDTAAPASAPVTMRWYTPAQVQAGAALYAQHCASCHKPNAEGMADWRTRDENGKLPPPPLNGTAHAWHHSLDVLRSVVKRGGGAIGGSMPTFADQLSSGDVDAILAWVQSHWSDEIYAVWHERDMAARGSMQATR
jgi:mono/diheme cytochrome c family protein